MKRVEPIDVDGLPVLFEVSDDIQLPSEHDTATEQLGTKEILTSAASSFDQAMVSAKQLATATVRRLNELEGEFAPDSYDIEFSVKLTAKAGIIAELGSEAQLQIRLHYEGGDQGEQP